MNLTLHYNITIFTAVSGEFRHFDLYSPYVYMSTCILSPISLFHLSSWGALVNSQGLLCLLVQALFLWQACMNIAKTSRLRLIQNGLVRFLSNSVSQSHINTLTYTEIQTCTQAHTYLAGLDRDNNPQSIFVWVLKTSIEKLIITHAMHQQTLKKMGNESQDNKRTDNKRRRPRGRRKDRGGEKDKKRKQTQIKAAIPGTDNQFVLSGVKGQLWVIHRALRLEPEDPGLHLCRWQHRAQQWWANQRAEFMTADDSGVEELTAFGEQR